MNKHSSISVAASLIATALLGCSAGDPDSSPASEHASSQAEIEVSGVDPGDAEPGRASDRTVLAEVSSAGTTVTFVEVGSGEERVVAMEIMGSLQVASPVERLLREQRLTMLELFNALSPDDAEPPAALLALHSEQAAAFGRTDTNTVLDVEVDANAPVEKSSTTCSNLIFNHSPSYFTAFNKHSKNNRSGTDTLYVGGDSTFHTGYWVTVGACNEGSSSMSVIASYEIKDDGDGWFHSPTYNLPAGGYFLYFPWKMVKLYSCTVGGLTLSCATGTRYRVQGTGTGPYHLKTAELIEVIK